MKVYTLEHIEVTYRYILGERQGLHPDIYIAGVFSSKQKAIDYRTKFMLEELGLTVNKDEMDFDFVEISMPNGEHHQFAITEFGLDLEQQAKR